MTSIKLSLVALAAATLISCGKNEQDNKLKSGAIDRMAWEVQRLADPRTGEIPENIGMRELVYAAKLPKADSYQRGASVQIFEPIGPYNVGGRTRAIAFDRNNENIILAGGVSGGMWRSINKGKNWERVTEPEDHSAVSCIVQDPRSGKNETWYYGSGETVGNSASKSFSAMYRGNGIYKSTDNGKTWTHLPSTTAKVNKGSDWDVVHNLAIDPNATQDVILAATKKGIMRSDNGGTTWTPVLTANSADFTNVVVTSTGVFYASISSDGGGNKGFWRSTDGQSWTNITPPGFPSVHQRTLMAIAPSNENVVYFYSVTPGKGNPSVPNNPSSEHQSLWKYTYVSGNGSGSGGTWENRSANLPSSTKFINTLNTQGNYCMSLAVLPTSENVLFLGGTNLFRSNNAFSTKTAIKQIGGYAASGYPNFDYYRDNQHPDQQSIAFVPGKPSEMLASTDGGLHFTSNCLASKVIWQSFNNGFHTTQFYGIGIDHKLNIENIVSGYQDNGSWWTNSTSLTTNWDHVMGGDGGYCAVEGGNTGVYYLSSQGGDIQRVKINASGNVVSRKDANPSQRPPGNDYLFIAPFILDPADNNKMYLPAANEVWFNSDLSKLDFNVGKWTKIATLPVSNFITAIAASKSNQGIVYVGTSNRKIYRIEHSGGGSANVVDVTSGITNGSYTSNITIDPLDDKKVMVVYSNYNVISIWYTEDGGNTWSNVEGNLKGDPDPGVPPNLDYIGNGPSVRWARIIHTPTGPAYLVGTSIGLFATNKLDGENTEWVMQGSDVIGNVVIEMIDHRETDGFTVIATHGMGAFKTYFKNNGDITSVKENAPGIDGSVSVYPNPAASDLTLRFDLVKDQHIRIDLYGTQGQMIETLQNGLLPAGTNRITTDITEMPPGIYFYIIKGEEFKTSGSFVKQ